MASTTRKRMAADLLEDSAKRLRIESSVLQHSEPAEYFGNDDDVDDDADETGSYQDQDEFSDMNDAQTVDSPTTPFSPGRKRFPSQLKTLECTYAGCNKTFNRPSRLATHLRSHANEKPFVCNYEGCDKAYIDDKHLKQHIKSCHSQERPYACEWGGCEKKFLTGTRLRRHQKVHEGENRFRCTAYPPCNESFRKHQTLERHIRSEHLQLAPFPCTYIDPITSVACNAGFDGSGGLRKHEEKIHGIHEFFCPECVDPNLFSLDGSPMHLGFTSNAKLQAHIKKDHANCPFCERKCASKRELEKHVECQHSGTTLDQRKKITCTYNGCKSSFTKKYNLDVHIRTVHEGLRYICGTFDISKSPDLASWVNSDGCGISLVSKANLIDHVRTAHLGLPSLINANRKKSNPNSDEEGFGHRAAPETKRGKRSKPTALEELLGTAYENDERRTILCLVPDCPKKFIRDCDLQNHLRAKHLLSTPEIDEFSGSTFGDIKPEPRDVDDVHDGCYEGVVEGLDNIGHQTDLDWEFQAHAMEGGPFWFGADDNMMDKEDQWMHDEMEMRKLIDDAELKRQTC